MTFVPSHKQRVQVADLVRPILNEARNLKDACEAVAANYLNQADEVRAEMVALCPLVRFAQIQTQAEAVFNELHTAILAYEGESGLPVRPPEPVEEDPYMGGIAG